MANIFDAKLRVTSETSLSKNRWEEITQYIKDNIAYDDYIDISDEAEYNNYKFQSYYLSVKWSLDYIKEYLQSFAKTFDVSLEARGEEETEKKITACTNCGGIEFIITETIIHKAQLSDDDGELGVYGVQDNHIDDITCTKCWKGYNSDQFICINF